MHLFCFAGIAQLVEPHVANVIVAGSSPVSRSSPKNRWVQGGIAKWLRQRSAKPFYIGSNPIAASKKVSPQTSVCGLFFARFAGAGNRQGRLTRIELTS